MDKLEIEVNGRWITVSPNIFRSWTGGRRKNGKRYKGKVFYYLTQETFDKRTNLI